MSKLHAALDARRWRACRRAVWERAGLHPRCAKCGRFAMRMEVDHVVPLDAGGAPYELDNLQLLCRGCHVAKTRRERVTDPERLRWIDLVGR